MKTSSVSVCKLAHLPPRHRGLDKGGTPSTVAASQFRLLLGGRSQLSTFMKAYTAYARGEGVWDHHTLSPENQHLFVITDNVL